MAKDAPAKTKAPKARGGTEKAKKEKKVKDPNAPKKPKSAYFHYMDDVRPQVTKDNPDKKITERSQIMAAMWNKIKETKEAEKYVKRAAEDKARYEKEKAAYEAK